MKRRIEMQEFFEYLTELRDGGTMNMMWAPTMLQADFDLDKRRLVKYLASGANH